MKTCVFIAIVVVGLSEGRFSDEKGCCLSSTTREKNVCRGRVIELSTEMARVAELTVEFCGMKREIDRKCLNHARVHANAQSFDRCEGQTAVRRSAKWFFTTRARSKKFQHFRSQG